MERRIDEKSLIIFLIKKPRCLNKMLFLLKKFFVTNLTYLNNEPTWDLMDFQGEIKIEKWISYQNIVSNIVLETSCVNWRQMKWKDVNWCQLIVIDAKWRTTDWSHASFSSSLNDVKWRQLTYTMTKNDQKIIKYILTKDDQLTRHVSDDVFWRLWR